DYVFTSTSGAVTIIDIMNKLDARYEAILIPAIRIVGGKSAQDLTKESKVDIELDGFALIKDNKLRHYADKQMSSCINILTNKYVNGTLNIDDPYDAKVGLE